MGPALVLPRLVFGEGAVGQLSDELALLGLRQPLLISDRGLEAAGLPEPRSVNGVVQSPIEGVSMVYTFDQPAAKGTHKTQYFEIMGNRAIYHDG